jgi:glycosyltransferase involved in cell wall biosynthesis
MNSVSGRAGRPSPKTGEDGLSGSVSVVITCHNLEKYIALAIESVLHQDYVGKVEVLVIDDASMDGSARVIQSYPSIRYLKTESNVGVLMATVMGIENTSEEHVFFLDGDDVWEPTKLSASMAAYERNSECSLVTHDLAYIDSAGQTLKRTSRPSVEMAGLDEAEAGEKTRRGILLHEDYIWLGSAISVHRTRSKLEGFCSFVRTLPDTFNTYQDWPLAFWVAAQPGARAAYVPKKLFKYRLHGANHSGDATTQEKAIRNFKRTLNTVAAIESIAAQYSVGADASAAIARKLTFSRYIVDLYQGQRQTAFKGFLKSLGYILRDSESSIKEVTRYLAVTILGLERFIAALNAFSRAKQFHNK